MTDEKSDDPTPKQMLDALTRLDRIESVPT
jgi:hypothetical protein